MDTFSERKPWQLPSSEKRSALKGSELAIPGNKLFPFRADAFFAEGVIFRKANRKSLIVSPL